VELNSKNFYN